MPKETDITFSNTTKPSTKVVQSNIKCIEFRKNTKEEKNIGRFMSIYKEIGDVYLSEDRKVRHQKIELTKELEKLLQGNLFMFYSAFGLVENLLFAHPDLTDKNGVPFYIHGYNYVKELLKIEGLFNLSVVIKDKKERSKIEDLQVELCYQKVLEICEKAAPFCSELKIIAYEFRDECLTLNEFNKNLKSEDQFSLILSVTGISEDCVKKKWKTQKMNLYLSV